MRSLKRTLAAVTGAALLLTALTVPSSAAAPTGALQMQGGQFKILVIADTHQTTEQSPTMERFIKEAVEYTEPDLVVYDGDNLDKDAFTNDDTVRTAIHRITDPVIAANIPFAVVFGNHDIVYAGAETSPARQLELFKEIGGDLCLTYSEDPSLPGAGNCNLPIYSTDGNRIVNNLYFLDSMNEQPEQPQIDWYTAKSDALKAANGGEAVPSLMFLHMTMPEIYTYMVKWPWGHVEGLTHTLDGQEYTMQPDWLHIRGLVLEYPSTNANYGLMDAMTAQGDIMAAIWGHDHINYYKADYKGIDMVNVPAATILGSYANVYTRGATVITLSENNPAAYQMSLLPYWKLALRPGSGIKQLHRDLYEWFTGLFYVPELLINVLLEPVRWLFGI
jgi:predicted phosphodiesterase